MKKTQKGFTIIEVALVLAIGALIFLVVFLAVPALQRNSRNDSRRRDVSNVVEAIADYSANNAGKALENQTAYDSTPKTDTVFGRYLDQLSNNTTTVTVKTGQSAGSIPAVADASEADVITVYTGLQCDGNENLVKGPARSYAVVGVVENAGGYSHICQNAS